MKIDTKAGDRGETSLCGGVKVRKDNARIEANGAIDELNASLGVVRAMTEEADVKEKLLRIQQLLMQIMSRIALSPTGGDDEAVRQMTAEMEREIDRRAQSGRFSFRLPGDDCGSAFVHVARTVCRRAERRLWAMHREHAVSPAVMQFMNRLSDYLFVLADRS